MKGHRKIEVETPWNIRVTVLYNVKLIQSVFLTKTDKLRDAGYKTSTALRYRKAGQRR